MDEEVLSTSSLAASATLLTADHNLSNGRFELATDGIFTSAGPYCTISLLAAQGRSLLRPQDATNVRYWHLADMEAGSENVRFRR